MQLADVRFMLVERGINHAQPRFVRGLAAIERGQLFVVVRPLQRGRQLGGP